MIDKWMFFFKTADKITTEQLAMMIKDDDIIKKAYNVVDSSFWTDKELMIYEAFTKRDKDHLSAMLGAKMKA